jgi:uncharacterized protein (DUF433 family)
MTAEIATEHPHVVRKPGTCGGAPLVRGTRITVRHIATLWRGGTAVDEIVRAFPHLQLSWVYDAISYYLDHQREIDQEIEANRIEKALTDLGGVMDEKGVIRFEGRDTKNGQ